ncbi:MAG: LysR family transcriptional regulator [Vannielia sp.]|uniref:LysR family transcriptional regulator n=1 Tax=Vannielia sp. TaxID=2813045 RepID=UPI003B8B8B3F
MSNRNNEAFDIQDLRVFASVVANGSMTGAAKQLQIGQPAVTRTIKDLEAAVGFSLFERNGPRISPTAKGLSFFEDAQQVLASFQQVSTRAAALREERLQSLTLVATPAMAAGLMPALLHGLGEMLPPNIGLPTMDAEHLAHALHVGAADFGICSKPLAHADLECLRSATSSLVAILPPGLDDTSLDLARLNHTRLLTVGNSYRIKHAISAALADQGIEPQAELTTNSSLNAIVAARAGLGIAIVDPVSAYGVGVSGAKVVPLQTEIRYEWGLFRRSGGLGSELETRLCESFCDASKSLGASCDV